METRSAGGSRRSARVVTNATNEDPRAVVIDPARAPRAVDARTSRGGSCDHVAVPDPADTGPHPAALERARVLDELAALRAQLREQRRRMVGGVRRLRDAQGVIDREVAACRQAGERLGHRHAPAPRLSGGTVISSLGRAELLLRELLVGGPVPTVEVERRAAAVGISPRTLARARQRLAVRARRVGGLAEWGAWDCELPTGRPLRLGEPGDGE